MGAKVKCARSLPEAVRQLRDPLGLTFSFFFFVSRRLLLPSRVWRHYVLDRLVSKEEPLAMKQSKLAALSVSFISFLYILFELAIASVAYLRWWCTFPLFC